MVRPGLIVLDEVRVEILLQLVDRAVDLLAERYPVEPVQYRLVEPLDDPV